MKDYKKQILAALALVLALGMVAPSATFASEGGEENADEGIMLLAGDSSSSNGEKISATDLYNVIDQARKTTNFAKYQALVNSYNALTGANPTEADQQNAINAIKALRPTAQLGDANAADLAKYIGSMKEYRTWSGAINAINDIMEALELTNVSSITAASLVGLPADEIGNYYNTINAVVNPVPETIEENVTALLNRIKTLNSFAGYRSAENLVAASEALIANKTDIDAKAQLIAAIGTDDAKDMTVDELIAEAKKTPSYTKYANLYNSMAFIRNVLKNMPEGSTVTDASLQSLLKTAYGSDSAKLMKDYSTMGNAAKAIDSTVLKNLLATNIPDTSAPGGDDKPTTNPDGQKPGINAPGTGIVGLFESGALDLGTITLIVSVAVASLAGLGLIAKLYLKHKF